MLRTVVFAVEAGPAASRSARERLRTWLEELGWPPAELIMEIESALAEAVTNSVVHARPGTPTPDVVEITAMVEDLPGGSRRVRVHVCDRGLWRSTPVDRSTPPHGMALMTALMAHVAIRPGDRASAGTEVLLISRSIPPPQ